MFFSLKIINFKDFVKIITEKCLAKKWCVIVELIAVINCEQA